MKPLLFALDRFEGDVAILQSPDGESCTVPRTRIAPDAVEGDLLEGDDPDPGRAHFRVAAEATRQARADAVARLERLRARDPGGDLTL